MSGLAIAAALFAAAVVIYRDTPRPSSLPVAIQSVSPESGDSVLRQENITVDLAVGYTGELVVNGVPIPEEQLFRAEALNTMTFEPGVDKVIGTLLADQNCMRVRYWLIAGSEADARVYDWCFESS